MSYINTLRHQFCGQLAGFPVYHLLEPSTDETEFIADDTYILLGGGSGELPAGLFDAVSSVSGLLLDLYIKLEGIEDTPEDEYNIIDKPNYTRIILKGKGVETEQLFNLIEALDSVSSRSPDFSTWDSKAWLRAAKYAKNKLNWTPYNKKDHSSLEEWLSNSIGEFVLVSMPELLTRYLEVQEHQHALDVVRELFSTSPEFGNVQQFPSGYQIGGNSNGIATTNMRY